MSIMITIPRPKILRKIKQDRLSAREHLRCLGQTLAILGLELREPQHILRPVNLETGEQRLFLGNAPFLWSPTTGTSHWDVLQDNSSSEMRLSLQPDEGSPMHATVQWLQSKNFRVIFIRDELHLDFTKLRHVVFTFM